MFRAGMMLLSILCFFYFAFAVEANHLCARYRVPRPSFVVYKPRGLEISIPHDDGINLVVFYVSVNKDLSETDADYIEYVVESVNGRWIFNKGGIRLVAGDIVHYKLYVQRYRRGYLYRGSPYFVTDKIKRPHTNEYPISKSNNDDDDCYQPPKDIVSPPVTTTNTPSTESTTTSTTPSPRITPSYEECSLSLNTVLKILSETQNELAQLRNDRSLLTELASAQPLTLRLIGLITETGEPKEVVEFVLFEKLDTRLKVKSATKNGTTITFELFNFEQKLDVLRRARKYLLNSKNILITA